MKPRFSLDLTNDSVSLLERLPDGWVRLGEVRLDAADLESELAALQALASARAPEGFTSKLILPNSQILYFETDASGQDRATRRATIRAALNGRTPYEVDELVFDFTGSGARTAVAVVARVTLEEAEAFAEAQGFRPVAFVAAPEPGRFAGEPFFGLTGSAERWLGDGVRLDRDQDPVKVVSAAPGSQQAPAASAVLPVSVPSAAEPAQSSDNPPDHMAPADETDTPDARSDEEYTAPASESGPSATSAVTDAEPVVEEAPFIHLSDDAVPEEAELIAPAADPDELPPAATPILAPDPAPSASASFVQPQAAPDDTPSGVEGDAPFQSRRQPAEGADRPSSDGNEEPGTRLAHIVPRLGGMTGGRADGATAAGGTVRAAGRQAPSGQTNAPVFQPRNSPVPPVGNDPLPGLERVASRIARTSGYAAKPQSGAQDTGLAGMFAGRGISGTSLDMPRLAAGAVAMVLLAGVLFWAFLSSGDPVTPTAQPVAVVESPATDLPNPTPTTETVSTTPPVSEPEPDPAASLVQPTVNAAAPAVQPVTSAGDSAALSAATGEPGVSHAAAATPLPDAATLSSDRPLAGQALPQPFGTLLRRDANGLIIATPEGVVTPGGFTLIAGKPARLPRPRPAGLAPTPRPGPITEAAADVPFADPALAGKVPVARPAGLTPPAAAPAAPDDGASLAPLAPPVDSRHTAMAPKARPAAVAAAAAARRAQDEAMADAAASAARAEAEAAAAALASASPQAVATSRRPQPRSAAAAAAAQQAAAAVPEPPTVDASAVDAALAEAQTAPEPEAAPAAEPAPEPPPAEVDEPEPEEGIATLPTTRTVAKKSTYANAIDLGDVNLIGVYGSSSNRRALVRMPNGRFVKVQVGDRLDGGKVAAIGDSELRYVKKGRTIVLKIMKNG